MCNFKHIFNSFSWLPGEEGGMLTRLEGRQQLYKNNVKQITQVLVALRDGGAAWEAADQGRWARALDATWGCGQWPGACGGYEEVRQRQYSLAASFLVSFSLQSPFPSYNQGRFGKKQRGSPL